LEGPGTVVDMDASHFLKRKCERRSLGECHDGFLVTAMAGPRGQLRWEVVRFDEEEREGREDELHGKEKERFLASLVFCMLSSRLFCLFPLLCIFFSTLTRIICLAATFTHTRFF
jgi:hypothetical protein